MVIQRKPVFLMALLLLLVFSVQLVQADLQIPAVANNGFIQTSGPNSRINVGDWWTNDEGANQPHHIVLNLPCVPNTTYRFELFDPEMNVDNDSNGDGDWVLDEALNAAGGPGGNPDADDTTFRIYGPTNAPIPAVGALLNTQVYTPLGGTNDTWVPFHTVTLPANPIEGTHCGSFTIQAETGDNDENGWRVRLLGGPVPNPLPAPPAPPETFDPLAGPDGVQGTGDEAWVGLQSISYQHAPAGSQTFYWFVDDGAVDMYMLNFDLDNNATVTYSTPSGQIITGTTSGQAADGPTGTGWNGVPMTDTMPTYADMATFDAVADFVGDAIASPEPGVWSANMTVPISNQYTFLVPGNVVYMDPPAIPELTIDKTDGVTIVDSPGSTTYTLTITNTGIGAALPIPGPEVVDTLPAGMSFVSCQVNAPLVGTCAESAPGSGIINVELAAQSAVIPAYLTGQPAAPDNSGTITITATIDPNLPANTTLENVASVDFTDLYGHNFAPVTDNDINTVRETPALDIQIIPSTTQAEVGDIITYQYVITNVGNLPLDNIIIIDSLGLTIVFPPAFTGTLLPGETVIATATYIIQAGDLPLSNTATVTANSTFGGTSGNDTAVITTTNPGGGAGGGTAAASASSASNGNNVDPFIGMIDPFITKTVDPPFALPGETVTWFIKVFNPGALQADNIVVTDTMPGEVEIVSVNQSAGSVSVNGQSITFTKPSLAPGESVDITVITRVRGTAQPPYVLQNTAVMTSPVTKYASATVLGVTTLPRTGETPWWRAPLLAALPAGIVVAAGCGWWAARKRRTDN